MANIENILHTTKGLLKANGITYQELAHSLNLSEASIKKIFSDQRMTLDRLDTIAKLMNLSLVDIIKLSEQNTIPEQLTHAQEQSLVDDPKLFTVFQLLIKNWSKKDIQKEYAFSDSTLAKLFIRLEKLNLVRVLQNEKVKPLIQPNFEWRKEGPVLKALARFVKKDFFDHDFNSQWESQRFLSWELTDETIRIIQKKCTKFVEEISELASLDRNLEKRKLISYGVLIGSRPWVFPLMKKYRK